MNHFSNFYNTNIEIIKLQYILIIYLDNLRYLFNITMVTADVIGKYECVINMFYTKKYTFYEIKSIFNKKKLLPQISEQWC
jgi:hypothetical protein